MGVVLGPLNSASVTDEENGLNYPDLLLQIVTHEEVHRAARDVEIHDRFPDTDFTFLHGSRSTRWTSIAPGTNITHAVIVIPRFVGGYNFTSAEVLYKAGADSKVTHGYSSAPGVRYVVTPSHFNRQFASHWLEWICFAFITAPCIVIPYMLWRSGASKYM
ncbi:unnamed protein product [Dibothriocephalus latus]|uniref:Translocon-associated protein subunit beta n=1 Tax=Dibothriocephalus latus TaxID=60516 RepID=A0A3P6TGT8_DIBLA|nr:unnamed protein product [Dibothriocephalus latus]